MARRSVPNFLLEASLGNFHEENDEDIEFFLNEVKKDARIEGWDNQKKILVLQMHLKGKTLKFIMTDNNATVEENFDR